MEGHDVIGLALFGICWRLFRNLNYLLINHAPAFGAALPHDLLRDGGQQRG